MITEVNIRGHLTQTAQQFGVPLSPERLDHLERFTGYRPADIQFHDAGVSIGPVGLLDPGVAAVHFVPEGWLTPHPDLKKRILHGIMGLQALQNYFLLVEAGELRRPRVLAGVTNVEMARVARRLGCTYEVIDAELGPKAVVEGEYSAVRDNVLSPKSARSLARLERLK